MKSLIIKIILLLVCGRTVLSQDIELMNIVKTNFPILKGDFYILDENSNIIRNTNLNDYNIKENGIDRKILNIYCKNEPNKFALSSTLVFDLSLSMKAGLNESRLEIAKKAGKYWLSLQNGFSFETALISFSTDCKLLSNYSSDISFLSQKIDEMQIEEFTHYIPAFFDEQNGALNISKSGKHRKIIIFLTDGFPTDKPDFQEIIKQANKNNISIYPILIAMNASDDMIQVSKETFGKYYENIYDEQQLKDAYADILNYEKYKDTTYCQIEWESNYFCDDLDSSLCTFEYLPFNAISNFSYKLDESSKYFIEFDKNTISLPNLKNNISTLDTYFTITANNRDLDIKKIYSDVPGITFSPVEFVLPKGTSQKIQIKYNPQNINPINSKIFIIYNDCIKSIDLNIDTLRSIVIVEDDSAYIGQRKDLKIKIINSKNIPQNYKLKISYNKTLLTITDPLANLSFNDTNEICEYSGYWNGIDSILVELKYIAGHGNAISTEIEILDFQWAELQHNVVTINGYFYILGLGKDKLIEPNILEMNMSQLIDKSNINISYKSMNGDATFKIYDIIGREINKIVLPKANHFSKFILPFKDLSIGVYFIILQSGEFMISKKIILL